jgi:hypothetical protein
MKRYLFSSRKNDEVRIEAASFCMHLHFLDAYGAVYFMNA